MRAIDPSSGELLREQPEDSAARVEEKLAAAHAAFEGWRRASFAERAEPMLRVAELFEARAAALAELMAREMGKPLREGRGEIDKCAFAARHFAEHAEAFLRDEPVEVDGARSYVAYRPLGLVLAIMPWNFPFWQVLRFAAPALMAGNGALLKHAPNVPGCALALEELFAAAGFPAGLFTALFVGTERVEALLDDPRVAAATLTGSVGAGSAVAAAAGTRIKKTVLELGGSDPYLVLEDAPLEETLDACARSRTINGGQSCIAAKRFVVARALRAAFEEGLVRRLGALRVGSPLDERTDLGPLAREDLRERLHGQVQRSVAAGARLLLGGELPAGPGWFYPPTVLTEVGPGMAAYEEELFGPVAAVIEVADEREAIRVANDTRYGLGAAVFTADRARGERIAALELEAGACFVNAFVRSDPRLPFGGVKSSGYGRELARQGIREFVNAKTVYVA